MPPPIHPPAGEKSNVQATFEAVKGKTHEQEAQEAAQLKARTEKAQVRERTQPKAKEAMERGREETRTPTRKGEDEGAQARRAQSKQAQVKEHRATQELRARREVQKTEFLSRDTTLQKARHLNKEQARMPSSKTPPRTATSWTPLTSTHTPKTLRQESEVARLRPLLPQPQVSQVPNHSSKPDAPRLVLRYLDQPLGAKAQNQLALTRGRAQPKTLGREGFRQFQPRQLFHPRHRLRSFEPERFSDLTRRVITQSQKGKFVPGQSGTPKVAVIVRGNLVFVKDGNHFRAFQRLKDGSLREILSKDASRSPLSPEAKNALKKAMAKKDVGTKVSSEKSELPLQELAQAKAQASRKGQSVEGELDFETKFTLMLYEVLEKARKVGDPLKGKDPIFKNKEFWEAFFAQLQAKGNQSKKESKMIDEILSLIFRGLFKNKKGQEVLVGDLKFTKGMKSRSENFVQLTLKDHPLLQMLGRLLPGKTLSKETLAKLFGEKLDFLKMAHVEEMDFIMGEGIEKHVQFNPKKETDPYLQARLEQQLQRARQKGKGFATLPFEEESLAQGSLGKDGFFANVYELINIKRMFPGSPKILIAMGYVAAAAAIGFLISYLF